MSPSSCHNPSSEAEVKAAREKEVEEKAHGFLRQVVGNLCIPEGITGRVDMAFHVNRRLIIARVLRNLAKEIEDGDDSVQGT